MNARNLREREERDSTCMIDRESTSQPSAVINLKLVGHKLKKFISLSHN